MVSLIIYGVIAIALASAAGYAFLTLNSTSQQTIQLQQNTIRLETATAALRATLLALNNDGVLFAPMGQAPSGSIKYTTLPAILGAVSSTPWGQPFGYCPVANETVTNGSETVGTVKGGAAGTDSYNVQLLSNASTQNVNYVVGYPANQTPANTINWPAAGNSNGYVAFIISGIGPGSAMPRCSDITVSSTGVTVAGGSVRGVTAGFTYLQRTIASTDRLDLYVGPAATGSGTGEDVNNRTTFDNALLMWQSLRPRLTRILLQGGTAGVYSTRNNMTITSATVPYDEGTTLVIASDNTSTTQPQVTFIGTVFLHNNMIFQNLSLTPTGNINMYNAKLTLLDVNFTGVLENSGAGPAPGSQIGLNNSNFYAGSSNFTNTQITLNNSISVISSYDDIPSGNTFVSNPVSLNNVNLVVNQSSLYFDTSNNSLTWSFAGGTSDPWALLSHSSNITFTAPTTATINNGVRLDEGSTLTIYGPTTISMPQANTIAQDATASGTGIDVIDSNITFYGPVTLDYRGSQPATGVALTGSRMFADHATINMLGVVDSGIVTRNSTITSNFYTGSLHVPAAVACISMLGGSTAGYTSASSPYHELKSDYLFASAADMAAPYSGNASETASGSLFNTGSGNASVPADLQIATSQYGLTAPPVTLSGLTVSIAPLDFETAVRNVINADITADMSGLSFLSQCISDQAHN